MSDLQRGDLVRWPEQKLTGIIVQFVGEESLRLYCEKGATAIPMRENVVACGVRDERGRQVLDGLQRAIWLKLTEDAKRHAGKLALRASRRKPEQIRDATGRVLWSKEDDWYGTEEDGSELLPRLGGGSPDYRLPPTRLAKRGGSDWSYDLATYLGYWVMARERQAMRRLYHEYPMLAVTMYHLHDEHGDKRTYSVMAELLGTSENAIKIRVHKARKLLRAYVGTPEELEASLASSLPPIPTQELAS